MFYNLLNTLYINNLHIYLIIYIIQFIFIVYLFITRYTNKANFLSMAKKILSQSDMQLFPLFSLCRFVARSSTFYGMSKILYFYELTEKDEKSCFGSPRELSVLASHGGTANTDWAGISHGGLVGTVFVGRR